MGWSIGVSSAPTECTDRVAADRRQSETGPSGETQRVRGELREAFVVGLAVVGAADRADHENPLGALVARERSPDVGAQLFLVERAVVGDLRALPTR